MNKFEFQSVSPDQTTKEILENHQLFIEELKENIKNIKPEEVEALLLNLERYSQLPDRNIEIYTDPKLDTFCCGEVPAKTVNLQGEIVDDPHIKHYLIGIPYLYVAGQAPITFLKGECLHELGHAKLTAWDRLKRFETLARQTGHDPKHLLSLNNCLEDPRMERLVGGPKNANERLLLFAKNKKLIIPSIASGFSPEKIDQMSPVDQFIFIIKLERLWALHERDLVGEAKPWNLSDLNPDVLEEYQNIKAVVAKITGDAVLPAMKDNIEVEKLIVDQIWPALIRIIDKYPNQEQTGDGDNSGQGGESQAGGDSDQSGKNQAGKNEKNENTQTKIDPEAGDDLDPNDQESWPDEVKKIFNKFKQKHQQRLQKKSETQKKDFEQSQTELEKIDSDRHELEKSRDNFENPQDREKYNEITQEIRPVIQQLKRIFKSFLPKIDEPQFEYGKKGIRFSVQKLVRKFETGYENPLGKRQIPEKNCFVLQLLVDVSGSMYDGVRINNAVKAIIAICEAAKDHNIHIEILANDDGNVDLDPKFLIKGFSDKYSGVVKTKIIGMLDASNFGGSNNDADAIKAAQPRLKKQIQRVRPAFNRVKSLVIYISDSTTESSETKAAAEETRQFSAFEGTAITPEGDIPEKVKYHFGPDSIIPHTIDDFPSAIQEILQRNIATLKSKE